MRLRKRRKVMSWANLTVCFSQRFLLATEFFHEQWSNHRIPESSVQRLQRVELQATGIYDEKWLQQLIFANADLLPFYEIDADYTGAVPVCMELATKSGRVDCIYVTPSGRLVIAETKLYRNPQSRREVIGQILDYAKDLMNWSYDELDTKVCAINGGLSLFELVKADGHEVLEASFIDTVQRNLSKGRFLLLVVGDGIREGF